jgi:SAM-dependent methyltransferase
MTIIPRAAARVEGVEVEGVVAEWIVPVAVVALGLLACTGAFFFVTTRGALLVRALLPARDDPAAHVYPIYANAHLMRLVDFQPIIAAILLFQYDRLVSIITRRLRRMELRDRDVLVTSCAFGNVMPRVARASLQGDARTVKVVDIIQNELIHAQRKMTEFAPHMSFTRGDAAALALADASVAANVVFFLLHELPHDVKGQVLKEACRVLEPGGQLFLAEFHRPRSRVLRVLSWAYFKVFEPLGLALWDTHDPLPQLEALGMRCRRLPVFFGNFQVILAVKPAP